MTHRDANGRWIITQELYPDGSSRILNPSPPDSNGKWVIIPAGAWAEWSDKHKTYYSYFRPDKPRELDVNPFRSA